MRKRLIKMYGCQRMGALQPVDRLKSFFCAYRAAFTVLFRPYHDEWPGGGLLTYAGNAVNRENRLSHRRSKLFVSPGP
jgi:hypothetical protein